MEVFAELLECELIHRVFLFLMRMIVYVAYILDMLLLSIDQYNYTMTTVCLD